MKISDTNELKTYLRGQYRVRHKETERAIMWTRLHAGGTWEINTQDGIVKVSYASGEFAVECQPVDQQTLVVPNPGCRKSFLKANRAPRIPRIKIVSGGGVETNRGRH